MSRMWNCTPFGASPVLRKTCEDKSSANLPIRLERERERAKTWWREGRDARTQLDHYACRATCDIRGLKSVCLSAPLYTERRASLPVCSERWRVMGVYMHVHNCRDLGLPAWPCGTETDAQFMFCATSVARRKCRQKDKNVSRRTVAEGVADRKIKGRRQRHKMLRTPICWKDEVSLLPCRILLHYFVYMFWAQTGHHRDGTTLSTSRWKYECSKLRTSCDTACRAKHKLALSKKI